MARDRSWGRLTDRGTPHRRALARAAAIRGATGSAGTRPSPRAAGASDSRCRTAVGRIGRCASRRDHRAKPPGIQGIRRQRARRRPPARHVRGHLLVGELHHQLVRHRRLHLAIGNPLPLSDLFRRHEPVAGAVLEPVGEIQGSGGRYPVTTMRIRRAYGLPGTRASPRTRHPRPAKAAHPVGGAGAFTSFTRRSVRVAAPPARSAAGAPDLLRLLVDLVQRLPHGGRPGAARRRQWPHDPDADEHRELDLAAEAAGDEVAQLHSDTCGGSSGWVRSLTIPQKGHLTWRRPACVSAAARASRAASRISAWPSSKLHSA